MSDLFFAYGTLRRGFSRHIVLRRLGALFLGQGTTCAELFDLGNFPGAFPAKSPSAQVVGEIYRLADPDQGLNVLDRVEGYSCISPETSIFRRELVKVTLENRSVVRAWVYWLNRWPGPRRRITSGDYSEYRDR